MELGCKRRKPKIVNINKKQETPKYGALGTPGTTGTAWSQHHVRQQAEFGRINVTGIKTEADRSNQQH